jgi:inner membrane protein
MKPVLKLILIGVLLLLLGVPIARLQGLVAERQQRGREVAADIAASSSRAQAVVGPLLRVEIERTVRRVRMVEVDGQPQTREELEREREVRLLTPAVLEVTGTLGSERRRRGLFEALVYLADLDVGARFAPLVLAPREDVVAQRVVDAALVVAVDDPRGLRAVQARLDGAPLAAQPGSGLDWQPSGFRLPLAPERVLAPIELALGLDLAGTESLHWQPVGDETRVALRGDWAHPSFVGDFLPDLPTIDAQGFEARWQVSRLAAQAPVAVLACGAQTGSCALGAGLGVRLLDPVDRYLKTDRAIKYAWLFMVLVFGALFFLELLRPVALHPLQYGLSGLALAMFFLLLLSLSEHIGFGVAYVVAALACIGLIGTYLAAPFGRSRAALFATLLGALYGLLYGVLQSEDYALLTGSLALFGLLAAAMLLSRRVDWSRLVLRPAPAGAGAEAELGA